MAKFEDFVPMKPVPRSFYNKAECGFCHSKNIDMTNHICRDCSTSMPGIRAPHKKKKVATKNA